MFITACSDGANAANAGVDNGSLSQGKGSDETGSFQDGSTLVDSRDGQTYRTVTIGNQTWMAQNLNYETDNSWCGGGSEPTETDCSIYGRLYTWAAAVGKSESECGYRKLCNLSSGNIRGVCPQSWHLPSKKEWETLIVAVDGSITENGHSNTAGKKLKSASGWNNHGGKSGNGTDAYSFSALPAGYRYDSGYCDCEGYSTDFWSSTEEGDGYAYNMELRFDYDGSGPGSSAKDIWFSVRCIKDYFF